MCVSMDLCTNSLLVGLLGPRLASERILGIGILTMLTAPLQVHGDTPRKARLPWMFTPEEVATHANGRWESVHACARSGVSGCWAHGGGSPPRRKMSRSEKGSATVQTV